MVERNPLRCKSLPQPRSIGPCLRMDLSILLLSWYFTPRILAGEPFILLLAILDLNAYLIL